MENAADESVPSAQDLITGNNAADMMDQGGSILHDQGLSAVPETEPQPFEDIHAMQAEGIQLNFGNGLEHPLQDIPFENGHPTSAEDLDIMINARNELEYLLGTASETMNELGYRLMETLGEVQHLRERILHVISMASSAHEVLNQMNSESNDDAQQ
ncbi:hypothetical protein O6H91_07G105500 [Diphasiastrum complanatum]|uniref:Uncharacterized protein n=1 Tax=Diphasiastrum complanatum TaxID=34168 RepID=A0ACC2D8X2_DIPCM|nr:hypothetical protein O6H91_07G105500 [Diphasiastrum complanatum]